MIVKLYADVYSGISAKDVYFNQDPGVKMPGTTRICIEVSIPEELVYNPDITLPSTTAVKGE